MKRLPLCIVTLSLVTAGCQLLESGCDLATCNSGLFIEFDAPPTTSVRVEATPLGEQPMVVECIDPRSCENGVSFPSFLPEVVHLKVTHGNAITERDVTPSYTTLQPNGPGCRPICRIARVSLALPR